jgi:signal recognition particle receptor subunit beta
MAILDTNVNRLIVRIAYDGPANAGKTTNLRQLRSFFTPLRRGEMFTPEERDGRTLFFDWLQVEGGLVGGYRLRCEMVTVPGQWELRTRRAHMIESADGVVFVCESTAGSMGNARAYLDELRRLSVGRALPIVVQANKQDAPDALESAAIADALETGQLPIVCARASQGGGVRETAVMVIRAVADGIQRILIEQGPDALVGTAEDPRTIYAAMRAAEDRAAPYRLEAPSLRKKTTDSDAPPLPSDSVATGLVWPALRGREVLRQVAAERAQSRSDLVGRNAGDEGSGKSDAFVYRAGPWCLKTSLRRRFADLEDARAALLRLARSKLALDDMLLPATVVSVHGDGEEGYWLWTIAPWVVTLRGEMTEAARSRDHDSLADALRAYAEAVAAAVRLASKQGFALDVHPSNFARHAGRLAYIDDDVDKSDRLPALGHAIVRRIDEYRAFESAVDAYLAHLGPLLVESAPRGSEQRDALCDSLAGAAVHTPEAEAGRALLIETLSARDARIG